MAAGLLHCTVFALSAMSCILLCFYPSAIRAIPIPWANNDAQPTSTEVPKSLKNFLNIHDNDNPKPNNTDQEPARGFHLKLEADITVNATLSAKLENFARVDREFFIDEKNSGFDDINGIFRPSKGFYLLSALVHVSVKPGTQEDGETTTTVLSDKPPRVTVTFCVNNNCGRTAILKSSSAVSSSGDLDTVSVSGVLLLQQGQQVTLNVENHSSDRKIVISEQSTLSAYLLKEKE